MFGIATQRKQRLRAGAKKNAVDHPLIDQRQRI
jgi:hypothetical protein